ncbi:MAG: hypothetical protein M1324_02690 [Patescibacteria group bacterium]|nr:hypothetical protein [Patescibacteria group bacterium]
MTDPNKWRAKIKELQNQLIAAQIAGDSVRAKKLKEDLRRVASVPFDSKIKQIENQRAASNQDRLPDAPVDRNAVRQDLLNQEQKELRKAQGLETEKPEEKYGGGPARKPFLTKTERDNAKVQQDAIDSDFGEQEQFSPQKSNAPQRNVSANNRNPEPEKANGPASSVDSESDGGEGESSQKGPNIRNAIANKAIDYAKKAALQAAKRIAVFFAANPYAWVVLGIIILIQIAVFATAMSMLGNNKVNTLTGGTFTQAADPIADKDWITKVLALAGDKGIGEKMSSELLEGLRSDLIQLQGETTDPEIKSEITAVLKDLDAVSSAKTDVNAKKLITSLEDLMKKFNYCAQVSLSDTFAIGNQEDKKGLLRGSIKRRDGSMTTVDQNMCHFLVVMEQNKPQIGVDKFTISTIVNAHSQYVKDSGKQVQSKHWTGKGIDLSKDNADKIMPWIIKNRDKLVAAGIFPRQVIGPDSVCEWQVNKGVQAKCFYDAKKHNYDHDDHIHIGF